MCSVFCCFVCCLFVVLGFWYTFVVSNVFLRVPKTESDFRCTEKAEFLLLRSKICTTTPSTTTTIVNINIVVIIHKYFYLVVIL